MTLFSLGRASALCVAISLLAGCGGSPQSQTTLPPASAARVSAQHHRSGGGDLVYAAGNGHTYVITYPQGQLVGTINEGGFDACSDSDGNVYLAVDAPRVDGFAHGATSPSTTFAVPGPALGCAIDPTTGNLAVTYLRTNGNNVAVFSQGSQNPQLFNSSLNVAACGYDATGNLFVSGTEPSSVYTLDELPTQSNSFTTLSITPTIQGVFGRVQWDGSDLTVQSWTHTKKPRTVFVSRLEVSGSTATVVGTTVIKGIKQSAFLSWIEGSRVLVPYGNASKATPNIGYWKYPGGGRPNRTVKSPAGRVVLNALTVSI